MPDRWEDFFQPDERLLWEGAPKPGIHGLIKMIGMALFGLPFLVIGAGTFLTGVTMLLGGPSWADTGFGLFLAAFSMPFMGVGAFLVIGIWFFAAQAHRRIRYALSTRCAYVAKAWWNQTIESYPILKSSSIGLEKGRSADTVWFHLRDQTDAEGDRSSIRVSFDNIADGDKVFHLLRSIQMGTP